MCPERLNDQRGFGLMAAVFVIVVLAAFGLLIARYTTTGAVSSAEDYVWAQALYAADSAARLRMLERDNGGNWPPSPTPFPFPQVGSCATAANEDTLTGDNGKVEVRGWAGEVSRTIVVNYRL